MLRRRARFASASASQADTDNVAFSERRVRVYPCKIQRTLPAALKQERMGAAVACFAASVVNCTLQNASISKREKVRTVETLFERSR